MIEKTNEADSFEETVKKAMISQPMGWQDGRGNVET